MTMQKTINQEISTLGCGLHSGREIKVTLKPAPVNSGIRFLRTDLVAAEILVAKWENITSTVLATTLGVGENRVSTVEHLMASLVTLGVDNLLVEVSDAELPIFDGSASQWVKLIQEAGLTQQSDFRRVFKITRPHKFSMGDKSIEVCPANYFSVEAHIDFGGFIGRHCFYYFSSEESFTQEISSSRTFCFLSDVEMMHSKGLALGGSLDNAVVVGDNGILNPDGLRYDNEFVRHKILDFIGDLAMIGGRFQGQFILHKPGHELNHLFLANVMEQPGLVEMSTVEDETSRPDSMLMDVNQQLPHLSLAIDDSSWAPSPANA